MPIPGDPLSRWWIEVSNENRTLVDSIRNALIAFIAFGPNREAAFVGTGFIIAGMPQFALALTAKHIFAEGITRIQRPASRHSSSALFVPASLTTPSINPEKLKSIWMGSQHANMLNNMHVSYNDTLDIAACIVAPQLEHATPFGPVSIPIHTRIPIAGEVVHLVSFDKMVILELAPPTPPSGVGHLIACELRVSIRIGVVTNVYADGFRQYRWPCFTTSIPAEPGMSGGLAYVPRDRETIAACGVICADNSSTEARTNWRECGESVIACTWPALGLRAPVSIPSTPSTATQSIYEMMRFGTMDMAVGGIDHIDVTDLGNGEYRMGFRSPNSV